METRIKQAKDIVQNTRYVTQETQQEAHDIQEGTGEKKQLDHNPDLTITEMQVETQEYRILYKKLP